MVQSSSRETLRCALRHQGGPVPMDFGSTAVTGMHCSNIADLRNYYGLERRPVKICEPYQMLGLIEEDLLNAIGVDTVGVFPGNSIFGFPNDNWKEWVAPWGQRLLVPGDFNTVNKGGNIYIFPAGDTAVPPSGHMPEGGFFFDAIIRQQPVDEEQLKPEENLEDFGPITETDLERFKTETAKAAAGGRGVVATFGGTAFGDIALVPAPFLKHPKGIRDISEWYMSTVMRQDYVHAIFAGQLEYALENLKKIHAAVGDNVDVVFLCGTDFGTQTGTFCSPEAYLKIWHPYYKKMNDWIHEHTVWKTFKHSCGAVEGFMELFIKSGFDIINPVQCSAKGMEAETLKRRYGSRLVFWGGGVDTQHILPFGAPEQVREQVLRRCEIFSRNGGFVFDAIHNIQAQTPVQNIVTMINAVHEFNG